ncbi:MULTISPECIES: mersacidin/lichenicidin family type 2 lantibiotic [Streptomyces]|uniref:Mersacidin/lichenicidin family type 2 lantibiotic n=2 Tax=Streptomyces violaceusniger group TaxID=2839105 RepID=A0A6G4AQ04_9ACTN|nr:MULTISPECIES: mersacidin/lichenicidin family type 2 lantibiotic [Streptomyces]MBA6434314.1 mersacidin/lichenicidin family type 2 lantibiotic [Streptomyces sp. GMR22]MBI0311459.1 mersacidin/lichenicidin family type 2 lantibiotic [Streptomyces javensis]MBI0378208.1 mersacidin/lichenicidin family type 2 lantibiotic [Streptomyces albiflaviniger]NEW75332.1 mersacidin/lichenicidin family type 2 lantibiotic [Streptomyces rhizosphaericus]
MSVDTVVRAWTDQRFRDSLSEEKLRAIPANPAGEFQDIVSFNGKQAVEASTVSVVCITSCVMTFGDSSDNCCAG